MKGRTVVLISICLIWVLLSYFSPRSVSGSNEYQVYLPIVVGQKQYTFLVAGHTYGVPGVNNPGFHPPFKAMFPQLNSRDLDFGVLTGDMVIWSTPTDWDEVDADLVELAFPVHFAVGNHDVSNRELFVSRYGPTFYSFEYQGDLFIVLDGELGPCDISGEQMLFLQNTLDGSEAQNVFVFVHKLIWVTEGTPYYVLRSKLNSSIGYDFQANFWTEVEPLLHELDAQVYVLAGDVGVSWAMSVFFEQYANIHLIANGMGGSEEESVLIFDVDSDGVQIEVLRLDGQPLNQGVLQDYNLAYYSTAH